MANVNVLVGKVLARIDNNGDHLVFVCESGEKYAMFHYQECCESVYIEDISGNLNDLIGSPLTKAEEVSNVDRGPVSDSDDYFAWTFYHFASVNGYVTIRWYGTSNGCYSVSVDFEKED